MELIQLKGVTKEFGKQHVLRDVNITVEEGDILGIIGKSGSGKTTLLNVLIGFMEPTQGHVLYYSSVTHQPKNLHEHLHKIKQQIGFTPQHNSFYPKLTVQENLLHFGLLYGMRRETLINNAKTLLNFTGLWEHRHKIAEHLSGGMQKRLDISCSLVHKPKLLVLDEPTADLDLRLQKEILHLLQEVNTQGVTMIIASHHLEGIEQICNKVAIIHDGTVHSHGMIDEVKKPFLRDYFIINLHAGSDKERVLRALQRFPLHKIIDQGHKLVIHPKDTQQTMGSLLQFIKEEHLSLYDVDLRKPSLNEIFEQITQ